MLGWVLNLAVVLFRKECTKTQFLHDMLWLLMLKVQRSHLVLSKSKDSGNAKQRVIPN